MHLKRLDKPDPPSVEVRGPTEVSIKWNSLGSFTGLQIVYKLFKGPNILFGVSRTPTKKYCCCFTASTIHNPQCNVYR